MLAMIPVTSRKANLMPLRAHALFSVLSVIRSNMRAGNRGGRDDAPDLQVGGICQCRRESYSCRKVADLG